MKYNICRFFNLYGSKQKEDFVIPKFVNAIKMGKSIKIYGDGKQIRKYCHVDDAANAIFEDEKKHNNTISNEEKESEK